MMIGVAVVVVVDFFPMFKGRRELDYCFHAREARRRELAVGNGSERGKRGIGEEYRRYTLELCYFLNQLNLKTISSPSKNTVCFLSFPHDRIRQPDLLCSTL